MYRHVKDLSKIAYQAHVAFAFFCKVSKLVSPLASLDLLVLRLSRRDRVWKYVIFFYLRVKKVHLTHPKRVEATRMYKSLAAQESK